MFKGILLANEMKDNLKCFATKKERGKGRKKSNIGSNTRGIMWLINTIIQSNWKLCNR